jgi:hypothetical protein
MAAVPHMPMWRGFRASRAFRTGTPLANRIAALLLAEDACLIAELMNPM